MIIRTVKPGKEWIDPEFVFKQIYKALHSSQHGYKTQNLKIVIETIIEAAQTNHTAPPKLKSSKLEKKWFNLPKFWRIFMWLCWCS